MPRASLGAALCALLLALASQAGGDALVRTQAMRATTIAELHVEADRVGVELEIGVADAEAFRNLLPDEIYEKLGRPPEPYPERLARFFARDLVIAVPDRDPLPGRLVSIEPRPRVRRDDITGEPLPAPEGEEPELVIFARLEYVLPGRPGTLVIGGPPGASVGFVVYHEGIAVNDFRYLSPQQVLLLDWEDPWYTRFERRALRRQYFAPMSGFLYVDPYEVRKEIIVRPLDLQRWVDLGLEGRETIPPEIQPELKRRVAAFLREHHPVQIDGVPVDGELARIHFLERTLRTSRVIDPPEELDVHGATLGAIFVYPTDGLPQRVIMDWDLWSPRTPMIPAASVDQAGPLPTFLEPDFRLLEWQNFLQNPEIPTLRELGAPPSGLRRWLLPLRWALLLLTFAVLGWCLRKPRGRLAIAGGSVLLTAACFWGARTAELSEGRAAPLVEGLLFNVYRAFDFRDEERIYDTLARSVDGPLLERTYLETRRGLELQGQGGARARVKTVELGEIDAEPAEDGAFTATADWTVAGSVGHWGHVHQRRNRYRAELRVAPVDGAWKLVDLEILDEERL